MGYFSEEDLENQYRFNWTYCPPELELFFYIEDLYDRYEELEGTRDPLDDPGAYYTDEQILYTLPIDLRSQFSVCHAIEVAEARFREYGLEYSGQMLGESRGQWIRRVVLQEEPDEFVKVHQDVFPAA